MALVAASFVACNDDDDSGKTATEKALIKRLYSYNAEEPEQSVSEETLTYDSQGRLTKWNQKNTANGELLIERTATYTYGDGTVSVAFAGADTYEVQLDKAGRASRVERNGNVITMTYDEEGHVSFELAKHGEKAGRIVLSVTGDHNVSNALASIAAAELLGIPMDTIKKGLLSFTGTDRRFEYKGTFNGVTVVDDYAHHPTEIKATLKAAQHYPHNSVWCVFQPHTYTRTKAFFHEFAEALSHTDHLVLADIYAARETDTLGISSADLAEEAAKLGADSHYFPSFAEIEDFLKENCRPGDLLITMGAGDIVTVGEDLIR